MQVKTTEIRIRERAGREVAKVAKLRIRKRLITCMAGLLSISKSDSGFVEPHSTKSDAANSQARTGCYAAFRLVEGPSRGLTTVPGVNPTTVQRKNSSTLNHF